MTTLNRLRRLARADKLLERHEALAEAQEQLINHLLMEMTTIKLEHLRDKQEMLANWLISLEQPELDIRGDLVIAERELADALARIEEHVL